MLKNISLIRIFIMALPLGMLTLYTSQYIAIMCVPSTADRIADIFSAVGGIALGLAVLIIVVVNRDSWDKPYAEKRGVWRF